MTIARDFCRAMHNAQDDYDESKEIERLFHPTAIRNGDERRLTFEDGSYVLISNREGVIELPARFA